MMDKLKPKEIVEFIKGRIEVGKVAVANVIAKLDTDAANRINRPEDEL